MRHDEATRHRIMTVGLCGERSCRVARREQLSLWRALVPSSARGRQARLLESHCPLGHCLRQMGCRSLLPASHVAALPGTAPCFLGDLATPPKERKPLSAPPVSKGPVFARASGTAAAVPRRGRSTPRARWALVPRVARGARPVSGPARLSRVSAQTRFSAHQAILCTTTHSGLGHIMQS